MEFDKTVHKTLQEVMGLGVQWGSGGPGMVGWGSRDGGVGSLGMVGWGSRDGGVGV